MHNTPYTPEPSRPSYQSADVDDVLLAEARGALLTVLVDLPVATAFDQVAIQTRFSGAMASLCLYARARGVPIEKLIVAVKYAWATLGEPRVRFGEAAPDVIGGAVSACIECYFTAEASRRAD
ncbi:MAG: hypothetical protein LH467_02080 [Gemmatimonadaceae bacterium]|nr:hypothetical protein [Gemmatimonadaceae bacterium]